MRQLFIRIPADSLDSALAVTREHDTQAMMLLPVLAQRPGEPESMALQVALDNHRVGEFIEAVTRAVPSPEFTFLPHDALVLRPPLEDIRQTVRDVSRRSTLELVLGSEQSMGSWRGLLSYAAISGLVAAYGAITNAPYLLTAAMLIAPMGAPAMVCVMAAGIGDMRMFGRGLLRFIASLAVLVLGALALGLAYGLQTSTLQMEQITQLSTWAVLLAIVAGAAGAQAQVQSERNSLVTGTATGFLVAVALSPPAAVLGLAIPLQRWDYVALMAFVLTLTFWGLLLGGWLSLLAHGVGPHQLSAGRGARKPRFLLPAVAAAACALLVVLQLQQRPRFAKADESASALVAVQQAVAQIPGLTLVDATAHFTRPDIANGQREAMLVSVVVEQGPASPAAGLEAAVRNRVWARIRERIPGTVPHVRVSVLPEAP